MLEKRLDNLEIKFTHQDDLVDQLNKIVTAQQSIIEGLQKDILEMKLLIVGHDVAGNRTPKDEVPPHY